jgi:CRP-like cAMP-binding protein
MEMPKSTAEAEENSGHVQGKEQQKRRIQERCVETINKYVLNGGKWWAFQKWLCLLPGFTTQFKNKTRLALLEKETSKIMVASEYREKTKEEISVLMTYWKELHPKLIEGVNETNLRLLASNMKCLFVHNRRRLLFEEGDFGNHFYVLLRGRVLIYTNNIKHTKATCDIVAKEKDPSLLGKHVATIHAGEAFGEIALSSDDSIRMASCLAVYNSAIIQIDRKLYNLTMKTVRKHALEFESTVKFLSKLPMFSGFTRTRMVHFTYAFTRRDMRHGMRLHAQGQKSKGVYILIEGEVSMDFVSDTGLIKLAAYTQPKFFGFRRLLFESSYNLKAGPICSSTETCNATVTSSHAMALFLPENKFGFFIDNLKATKAWSFLHYMLREEKQNIRNATALQNMVTESLHKNDPAGTVTKLYIEQAPFHRLYEKPAVTFPSPQKSSKYGDGIKHVNCTVNDLDAQLSVTSALLKVQAERVAIPTFSKLIQANRNKTNEVTEPLPPPAAFMSTFDRTRSDYLKTKRQRWLQSSNLKLKRNSWKKTFKRLARDQFDVKKSERKLYDSHGRVVAQIKG